MTYIIAGNLTREKHVMLLAWLESEGVDPTNVSDNGRFSVHDGRISGFLFLRTPEGRVKVNSRDEPVLVHFTQAQKNPLPEVLNAG